MTVKQTQAVFDLKPIDYLLRQMELEGIKRAGEDLITRISPNVDEYPLVLCARTADNEGLVCFDDELPREVRATNANG